ncbi:hypothetical protein D3C86_1997550 [compost metagenome]
MLLKEEQARNLAGVLRRLQQARGGFRHAPRGSPAHYAKRSARGVMRVLHARRARRRAAVPGGLRRAGGLAGSGRRRFRRVRGRAAGSGG